MNQGNAGLHATDDWPRQLKEIREFLEMWHFAVSDLGHVYVEPQSQEVDIASLRFFLGRLRLMRESEFPRSVTFDFTRATFTKESWAAAILLLDEYATEMNASLLPGEDRRLLYLHRRLRSTPGRLDRPWVMNRHGSEQPERLTQCDRPDDAVKIGDRA